MADETVLIHHRGAPAIPPIVNGITFAPHPDDPTRYVGEASADVAAGLCVPGSPFQAASALPPPPATLAPEGNPDVPPAPDAPPAAPGAIDAPAGDPSAPDAPPAALDAPGGADGAPDAPDEAPETQDAPSVDPDAPTSGPGITEPVVVPPSPVQANPVPSPQVEAGLSPEVLLGLRAEQGELQALDVRTPEQDARLAAISEELAFAGFQQ